MKKQSSLFEELVDLTTEKRNPASMDIDSKNTIEIVKIINSEDKKVAFAVEQELGEIARAVEVIVNCFKQGGRLFYVGAGTSGRVGVQDAAECPPTFGSNPELIQGLIAGGKPALLKAQEGAEDHEANGANDIIAHGICRADVVVGIAASQRTPYVVGAIKKARELGPRRFSLQQTPVHSLTLTWT